MIIEPAMRQPSALHHFGDANPTEPALAKQLRGSHDDPVMIVFLLFLRNTLQRSIHYHLKDNREFDSVWGLKAHLRGLIDFANMIEPDFAETSLKEFDSVEWPV